MTADLEALVVGAYVFADEYPVPPRPGRPAQVSDAELVALAVCQAAMGIPSDRQFLGLVERILPGWFQHLPASRSTTAACALSSSSSARCSSGLPAGSMRAACASATARSSLAGSGAP
jgi:hypothetical protein